MHGEKHHVVHIAQVCEAGVEVDPGVNHNIKEVLHGDAYLPDPWNEMLPSACTLHKVLEWTSQRVLMYLEELPEGPTV